MLIRNLVPLNGGSGCATPLGGLSRALVTLRRWPEKTTQPKIIGLDSIPTAVRYRIEDKEELESST